MWFGVVAMGDGLLMRDACRIRRRYETSAVGMIWLLLELGRAGWREC